MYKLNRRVIVRRYGSVKNEFGGLVSVPIGSWEKWATVEDRRGDFNDDYQQFNDDYQQSKWAYDTKVVMRYERERPTKVNDTIDYEGLHKIISVEIKNEGAKWYEILRCKNISSNINSDAPMVVDSIQVINYTGIDGEDVFVNTELIGKESFAAFKDGIQFVIVTGTPTGKEVKINNSTGSTLWGVPFSNGEVATIIFHG